MIVTINFEVGKSKTDVSHRKSLLCSAECQRALPLNTPPQFLSFSRENLACFMTPLLCNNLTHRSFRFAGKILFNIPDLKSRLVHKI